MYCKTKCGFLKKCNPKNGMCILNKSLLIIIIIIIVYLIAIFMYYYNLTKKNQNETYKNKNWNEIVSDCYYINLDKSNDRKIYMENILKEANINCKRFSAIDGNKYKNLCDKLNITPGALGCKLSHLQLLKNVKKNGWTIIFEDDIKIDNTTKNNILTILNSLPENSELVLFGTSPRIILLNLGTFQFKKYNDFIWETNKNLSCGHAYAIKYSGAQKWIPLIEKYLCDKEFDMHEKGIDTIYFAHSFSSNLFDLFNIFSKDYSFIPQNKDKFGYFDSTITNFNII
jgi:GR25 family glycosyltransferase involved in LPS biosynthesis